MITAALCLVFEVGLNSPSFRAREQHSAALPKYPGVVLRLRGSEYPEVARRAALVKCPPQLGSWLPTQIEDRLSVLERRPLLVCVRTGPQTNGTGCIVDYRGESMREQHPGCRVEIVGNFPGREEERRAYATKTLLYLYRSGGYRLVQVFDYFWSEQEGPDGVEATIAREEEKAKTLP